jgi:hypothetical protein
MDINRKIAVLIVFVAALASLDGRSNRATNVNQFTYKNDLWGQIKMGPNDGWYRRELRMTRICFDKIVGRVEARWEQLYNTPYHNSSFCGYDRVKKRGNAHRVLMVVDIKLHILLL